MMGTRGIFNMPDLNKVNKPAVYVALSIVSASAAYFINEMGMKTGVLLLLAMITIPLIYAIVAYPKIGILSLIVFSYLLLWIMRMNFTTFPLGTIGDGLLVLLIIGFFIKQKYKPDWEFLRSPISILILIWIGYNVLQVLNPAAASQLAWLYTIRSTAAVMITYFIFSYHIKTISFVRLILSFWLALGFFAAVYAFKQQHFGFFAFELDYINSDPMLTSLLFIWGEWRKFSIFSDPVAFAYNMVICSIICVGFILTPISRVKKIGFTILALFFLLNMLYSGTRGAYVLFPAALALLGVIRFNKHVLIFTILAGLFIAFLIKVPTSSITLYRFQTAFKPSNDASFNVRVDNQKKIQPYIQSHPFGGGLGATGVWGVRFAPDSYLAKFPPDSGYVRIAVEQGWIGLFIFCTLIFTILKTGIDNYFKINDPELKAYCLAMVLIIFALHIGNYPQEALVQYPNNILFYLACALIGVLHRIDKTKIAKQAVQ